MSPDWESVCVGLGAAAVVAKLGLWVWLAVRDRRWQREEPLADYPELDPKDATRWP